MRIFRILPHMRSHISAFLAILSNVNTRARVIYAAYFRNAAYMPHILAHISPNSAYFAPKRPAYFKKIFRYKPVSLIIHTNCANVVENNMAVHAHWPCHPAVLCKDTMLIRVARKTHADWPHILHQWSWSHRKPAQSQVFGTGEMRPAACESWPQSALDFSSSPILYAIILFQSIFILVMGSWRRSALNVVLDIDW